MHKSAILFFADQNGATAIEYALIASLVSVFIVGALLLMNASMIEMFEYIRENIVQALAG